MQSVGLCLQSGRQRNSKKLQQQQLAQPDAGTWFADEVMWAPVTEEQKLLAQRRMEALDQLGEQAMQLDAECKGQVEAWRRRTQEMLESESNDHCGV